MALTLRPTMWTTDGPVLSRENPIQFEVLGLPPGQSALIGQMPIRWQVLHYKTAGAAAEWQGDYDSKEDALAALEAALSS
jgi:hypothetical protein